MILPPPRLQERGIDRLGAEEGAGEIAVDDRMPLGERVVLGLLADVDAGIVDQDVDAAEVRERPLDQPLAIGLGGDVRLETDRVGAQLAQRGHCRRVLLGIAPDNGQPGSGLAEPERHAVADPAIAPGDDRHPPRQIEQFHSEIPTA